MMKDLSDLSRMRFFIYFTNLFLLASIGYLFALTAFDLFIETKSEITDQNFSYNI